MGNGEEGWLDVGSRCSDDQIEGNGAFQFLLYNAILSVQKGMERAEGTVHAELGLVAVCSRENPS